MPSEIRMHLDKEKRIRDLEDMLCRALIQMDRPPDAFSTDVHWEVWDGFMAEACGLLMSA